MENDKKGERPSSAFSSSTTNTFLMRNPSKGASKNPHCILELISHRPPAMPEVGDFFRTSSVSMLTRIWGVGLSRRLVVPLAYPPPPTLSKCEEGFPGSFMDMKEAKRSACLTCEIIWCLGPESNRYGARHRGILSPLRLPLPPPRPSRNCLRIH
jgi:hypothetical protein